ncbi:MAG: tetratricopeptide repeat protein [Lysobacterales bacterium]
MERKTDMTPDFVLARRAPAGPALLIGLLLVLLLPACTGWQPASVEDREVDTRVREPARQDSAGVQVFPLQNPAVKELIADASAAEDTGDYKQAAVLLERALRIQPRDPQLLQSMAEVQLRMKDYEQALNFAVRSYDSGPRVGEICSRNWRTIGVAREHLGDTSGARLAEQRATECMNTRPEGL